jgi:hypothetical protein
MANLEEKLILKASWAAQEGVPECSISTFLLKIYVRKDEGILIAAINFLQLLLPEMRGGRRSGLQGEPQRSRVAGRRTIKII